MCLILKASMVTPHFLCFLPYFMTTVKKNILGTSLNIKMFSMALKASMVPRLKFCYFPPPSQNKHTELLGQYIFISFCYYLVSFVTFNCFLMCDTQFAGEIVKTMLKLSELVRDPLSSTSQSTVSLYEVFNIVFSLCCTCARG